MEPKYKTGDVVILNSGGPDMTIKDLLLNMELLTDCPQDVLSMVAITVNGLKMMN